MRSDVTPRDEYIYNLIGVPAQPDEYGDTHLSQDVARMWKVLWGMVPGAGQAWSKQMVEQYPLCTTYKALRNEELDALLKIAFDMHDPTLEAACMLAVRIQRLPGRYEK